MLKIETYFLPNLLSNRKYSFPYLYMYSGIYKFWLMNNSIFIKIDKVKSGNIKLELKVNSKIIGGSVSTGNNYKFKIVRFFPKERS